MRALFGLAARPLAPAVATLAALGFFAAGGLYARDRRQARESATAAAQGPDRAAAAPHPPAAPPPADTGPHRPPVAAPPSLPGERPAPPCVAELVKQHVARVGPGVAVVGCEGRNYQCVVTVVRGQIGFNCAELAGAAPPPAAGQDLDL